MYTAELTKKNYPKWSLELEDELKGCKTPQEAENAAYRVAKMYTNGGHETVRIRVFKDGVRLNTVETGGSLWSAKESR